MIRAMRRPREPVGQAAGPAGPSRRRIAASSSTARGKPRSPISSYDIRPR